MEQPVGASDDIWYLFSIFTGDFSAMILQVFILMVSTATNETEAILMNHIAYTHRYELPVSLRDIDASGHRNTLQGWWVYTVL